MAGGFPRNLARLTNVDKACLDDVATRLRHSAEVIAQVDALWPWLQAQPPVPPASEAD